MIYRSKRMTLRSVMDVFQGKVNDVMICEEVSGEGGNYYTLLVVKDHKTAQSLLHIMQQTGREVDCCIDMFSSSDSLCMVFPYVKERKLKDFYMAKAFSLSVCESICLSLVLQCMTSTLPYPLLELVLKQGQINLLKDNSIVLGYCMDLSQLDESSGQKECAMQCAAILAELLQKKGSRKNVSYQLLLKKIPKQAYRDFRELYKDIRLSQTSLEKRGVLKRIKDYLHQNQSTIFRVLFYLTVILMITVAIMFLSDLIWGENPFLRFFNNSYKHIGTESLTK